MVTLGLLFVALGTAAGAALAAPTSGTASVGPWLGAGGGVLAAWLIVQTNSSRISRGNLMGAWALVVTSVAVGVLCALAGPSLLSGEVRVWLAPLLISGPLVGAAWVVGVDKKAR